MKTYVKQLALSAVVIFGLAGLCVAHEGHDHDQPASVQAPKGGVIKQLDESYVEVLSKGKELKIYFYASDLKPADLKRFEVTAQAQPPRGKKAEAVTLIPKDGHFEAAYDAKGVHRYTLVLKIKDASEGHFDTLNFTIEPRK